MIGLESNLYPKVDVNAYIRLVNKSGLWLRDRGNRSDIQWSILQASLPIKQACYVSHLRILMFGMHS
eukprot:jgi/Botrbrau1/18072/Bobra.0062s0058.1